MVSLSEDEKYALALHRAKQVKQPRKTSRVKRLQMRKRRERVYELMLRGLTHRQMGEQLGVSVETIRKDIIAIRRWYESNPEDYEIVRRETLDALKFDKVMQARNLLAAEPGSKQAIDSAKAIAEIDMHILRVISPQVAVVKHSISEEMLNAGKVIVPETPIIDLTEYNYNENSNATRSITSEVDGIQVSWVQAPSGPDSFSQGQPQISSTDLWPEIRQDLGSSI
jgi:hypothetical protein